MTFIICGVFPSPASSVFCDSQRNVLKENDIVRFPKLADTYQRIAEEGPDIFYRGSMAQSMVEDIQAAGPRHTSQEPVPAGPADPSAGSRWDHHAEGPAGVPAAPQREPDEPEYRGLHHAHPRRSLQRPRSGADPQHRER